MDFFKFLLAPIAMLIKWIDNGDFFKHPMQWFYIICGTLSALTSLYAIYYLYNSYDIYLEYSEGWDYFVALLMLILVVLGLTLSAIYSFYYWLHRSKRVIELAGNNEKITAIPVVGNICQTAFEVLGLQIMLIGCYLSTLAFIYAVLTWSFGDFDGFITTLFIWFGGVLLSCILGYLSTLLGHFFGEKCRIWAIVGNNVDGIHQTLQSIARTR